MDAGPRSASADQRRLLRWGLLGSAFLMIVIGVFVFLMIDEVAGIVVGAVGVFDLLTLRFVMGAIERGRARGATAPGSAESGAAEAPGQPGPSYNPYARED
jgi:hypothetical protein